MGVKESDAVGNIIETISPDEKEGEMKKWASKYGVPLVSLFDANRDIMSFLKEEFSRIGLCDTDPSWIEHYCEKRKQLVRDGLTLEGWIILEIIPEIKKLQITSEVMKRAMTHPVVLEVMADCADVIDAEISALCDPEVDSVDNRYILEAMRLRDQAMTIRDNDPDIWPTLNY